MKREIITLENGLEYEKVAEINGLEYYIDADYGIIHVWYKKDPKPTIFIGIKTEQFIREVAEQQGQYIINKEDVIKCFLTCGKDYYEIKEYFTV